ncbi:MAG: 4Fe-4S dicluster domain-containing protein [Chlorobiota bacterium]|nr:MAG: 4Fe-4S dicluster domain-containing protein [Chlorobiota bacterium]
MPHEITDTCIGCTACASICPTEAIYGEKKMLHHIIPERCIDCAACSAVCPVECILDEHDEIKPRRKLADLPKATVVPESCTGCEFCVDVCPYGCITLKGGAEVEGVLAVAEVDPAKCVGCGLCVAVCDKEAILVHDQAGNLLQQDKLKIYEINEYSR